MTGSQAPNRREFVGRIATTAVAVGIGAMATPSALDAEEIKAMRAATGPGPAVKPDNSWLQGIKGNHAQIFDMPTPNGGFPLLHVRNYMQTYQSAFEMTYPHVLAIVGLYGFTTPMAFNDAMWAKYRLGAASGVNDRVTKAPATTNVFASAPEGEFLGAEARIDIPGDSSITALQALGTRFIVCNNAFNFWVGRIAAAVNQPAAGIRSELEANMLPRVTIVPAMVIAMNQAQAEGASYMYLA
ncbi:MAG: twin-arginine translocation signal domain-containing protein [Gemmatimonadaceae bacterium]